jgi:hypothetical protein
LNDSPPTIKRLSQVNLQHKSSWVALQDEKRETLRWETGSATALVDCPPVLPKRSCCGGTEDVFA